MLTRDAIVKHTIDTVAGLSIVGAIVDFVPTIVAIAGGIWYAVQIYESKTVQRWLFRKRRAKARLKRQTHGSDTPTA